MTELGWVMIYIFSFKKINKRKYGAIAALILGPWLGRASRLGLGPRRTWLRPGELGPWELGSSREPARVSGEGGGAPITPNVQGWTSFWERPNVQHFLGDSGNFILEDTSPEQGFSAVFGSNSPLFVMNIVCHTSFSTLKWNSWII